MIYIYTHMNDIHDNHGKYDNHGTKNHNSSVLKVDDFNNDKTMMVLTIYLNMWPRSFDTISRTCIWGHVANLQNLARGENLLSHLKFCTGRSGPDGSSALGPRYIECYTWRRVPSTEEYRGVPRATEQHSQLPDKFKRRIFDRAPNLKMVDEWT